MTMKLENTERYERVLGHFRRKIVQPDWSFCPSTASQKGLHSTTMRPFLPFVAEQKSGVILDYLFLAMALREALQ